MYLFQRLNLIHAHSPTPATLKFLAQPTSIIHHREADVQKNRTRISKYLHIHTLRAFFPKSPWLMQSYGLFLKSAAFKKLKMLIPDLILELFTKRFS